MLLPAKLCPNTDPKIRLCKGGGTKPRRAAEAVFEKAMPKQASSRSCWLRRAELNRRSPGYEPGELPDFSTARDETFAKVPSDKVGLRPELSRALFLFHRLRIPIAGSEKCRDLISGPGISLRNRQADQLDFCC